jgi:hypothetical protein
VRGVYRLHPRLDTFLEYIYGAQLDMVPSIYQLVALRSHVGIVGADLLAFRNFGLRASYKLEFRTNPYNLTIPIHTPEIGLYTRW